MRTTIILDDDVLDRARKLANERGTSFRSVVNEALRAGLGKVEESARSCAYRTKPHAMGLRQGGNLDNIQELLARTEGEDFR
ncbi:MAG: type II toxin-antitoxin system VapB family antitoxin [Planctomycetota bacterium]